MKNQSMGHNKKNNGKSRNRKPSGGAASGKKPPSRKPSLKEPSVTGIIEGTGKGYGFLTGEKGTEDIFIAAGKMNGALHGDTVEANMISRKKGGGEAEVTRIIKPRPSNVVGTYFAVKNNGYLVPDDARIAKEIFVAGKDSLNAAHLDKAVVELNRGTKTDVRSLEGKIVEVLGAADEKGIDILSIIRSYNLYEVFPSYVIKQADKVAVPVAHEEKARRRDFTADSVFTIDGDDSKDFDDAVSLTKNENGNYILGVHIADVTHYVRPDSALDKEAFKRGTSVYFADRVIPMLPESLSNGICSLNEGEERLTLSCVMEIDGAGTIVKYEITEGVINSRARLTYSAVSAVLEGKTEPDAKYKPLMPTLKSMERLAGILFKKRKNRGNIEFDLPECEIVLDENGKTTDVKRKPRLIAHRIIEEFMLAANESVAGFLCKLEAPGVFRAHEEPPADKVEGLKDFLSALGIPFAPEKPAPADFAKLLERTKDGLYETAVSRAALRTMSKATYTPENKGHFGLSAEYYCHFTSPIRRYPDLAVHRIVKDYLKNGKTNFKTYVKFTHEASSVSSERERAAEKAERDVDDLKKAEYMSDKVGNRYTGHISGVTEWGIFVELENTVEGMIRTENLPGDHYEYIQRQMRITNGVRSYRIGDAIPVEVAAVHGMKVEFLPVPENTGLAEQEG